MLIFSFFFFNDTATTEIYTLSLHDALPIFQDHAANSAARPIRMDEESSNFRCIVLRVEQSVLARCPMIATVQGLALAPAADRKSTRLNSSHLVISYAVFCLKKKNRTEIPVS